MPIHQNEDGTWQWGKSGKKYKKKEDAIKQMKAIFASGYVEKHASYTDTLNMIKRATDSDFYTVKKGDRLWRLAPTFYKHTGLSNRTDQLEYLKQLNPKLNFQSLQPEQRIYLGTRGAGKSWVSPNRPVRWTQMDNLIAATRAKHQNRLFTLLPEATVYSPYVSKKEDSIGYLKNPRTALYNALALKQSSANRFTHNGKAAGAWQIYPQALHALKQTGQLPKTFSLQDIYKDNIFSNNLGPRYYDMINKDNPSPSVGYSRYMLGRDIYKTFSRKPGFKNKYPTEEAFALNYKGQYHPKGQRKNYGARVKKFIQLLNQQKEKAQRVYPDSDIIK